MGVKMIKIMDKETGLELGVLSEEQLQFLIDALEEEYEEDRDYYINRALIEDFESQEADPKLIATLKQALGDREDMEIVWSRT